MKTYKTKSNAKRAALAAIKNLHPQVISVLKSLDLYYKINGDKESGFSFELLAPDENTANPKGDEVSNLVRNATVTQSSKPKKVKYVHRVRNGVRMPKPGGKCAAVWALCDALNTDGEATLANVKVQAESEGMNPNNVVIEFYNWRKFNA